MSDSAQALMSSAQPLCLRYDVALLDLDGVVYVGPDAVAHAQASLQEAHERGMRLAYVTNNAARPPGEVAAHLQDLGIPALVEEIVTSAQAAARMLAARLPSGSRVLVVGGEGLRQALIERDLVPVGSADDDPQAVAQGFSPDIGWRLLAEGALALRRDIPWVASNLDLTIPTPRGRAPGNGTLVNVLRSVSGREPLVAGKPELPLHAEAVRRSQAQRPLVVGDRLDTDIEGANRASTDSLLVLTGVTTAVEAALAPPHLRPSYLGADLRALLHPHPSPDVTGEQSVCGQWRATLDADARLRVGRVPGRDAGAPIDILDALRATCALTWRISPGRLDTAQVAAALTSVGLGASG